MVLLSILFLATAALYSSVGFGGGSTYLALLLIWETPYFIFPLMDWKDSKLLQLETSKYFSSAGDQTSIS